MSQDVFNIPTPFADVAALGQGYAMRADGEYLWLPLPQLLEVGTSIQFMVLLQDGTPAFAGAGQCVQVADTGEDAHPQVRFETALGALQFDERSMPVYEYLVAIHAAAVEAQHAEEGVADVADVAVAADQGAEQAAEQQAYADEVEDAGEAYAQPEQTIDYAEADVGEHHTQADESAYAEGAAPEVELSVAHGEIAVEQTATPSVIPTGILSRPAIALGWKPPPAQPPQPSGASGLFQYAQGPLPIPAEPPRPDIDPSLWVQPAPRPGAAAELEAEQPEETHETEAELLEQTYAGAEAEGLYEAPQSEAAPEGDPEDAELEVDYGAAETDTEVEYAATETETATEYAATETDAEVEYAATETDAEVEYAATETETEVEYAATETEVETEAGTEYATADGAEQAEAAPDTDATAPKSGYPAADPEAGELDVEIQ